MTMTEVRPSQTPLFIEQMDNTKALAERLGPEIARLWNEFDGPKLDKAGKTIRVTLEVAELADEFINQHPQPGKTFHQMVQEAYPGERDCRFTLEWVEARYTGRVYIEQIIPFANRHESR